ncbi:MAG: hypothetical protein MJ231_05070, partial [bacterium]|nr:hypothetical protein [bacterium]
MTQHNENSLIPVSEGVTTGNLQIIPNNSSQIISATNNRAQYFAEQAKKYKEDACNYMLTAKEYAESNADISQNDLDELSDNIINIINGKESLLAQDIDNIEGVIQNITPEALVGKSGLYLTTDGESLSWGNVVEYSEYSQAIGDLGSTKVDKSGDTMTGTLNIDGGALNIDISDNFINCTSTNITDSTTTPSANTYCGIQFNDNNGVRFGNVEGSWKTEGYSSMGLVANRDVSGATKYAKFECWVDSNGKANYSPAQLITVYSSGTSGYMIWSNGYCIQWGVGGSYQSDNRYCTVTLAKKFANTNYNVTLTAFKKGMDNGICSYLYSKS